MFRDVPMFRYVFRNVPFSWLSTAFKRPKRAVILRFKMDEGCFELSRDRIVWFSSLYAKH